MKFWDSSATVALIAAEAAAAIVAAERDPATLEFVSLDERLREAAMREGFRFPRLAGH